jgi:hypothetical protein
MIILTAPQSVETYTEMAESIGERYHGEGIEDFTSEEWLELCDFAEDLLYSAGIKKEGDA